MPRFWASAPLLLPELLELGDVGLVVLRDVRDGDPAAVQVRPARSADARAAGPLDRGRTSRSRSRGGAATRDAARSPPAGACAGAIMRLHERLHVLARGCGPSGRCPDRARDRRRARARSGGPTGSRAPAARLGAAARRLGRRRGARRLRRLGVDLLRRVPSARLRSRAGDAGFASARRRLRFFRAGSAARCAGSGSALPLRRFLRGLRRPRFCAAPRLLLGLALPLDLDHAIRAPSLTLSPT